MKYDTTRLSKLNKVGLQELRSKLLKDLHLLEMNQAQNREVVRIALQDKDIVTIKISSNKIRDNRRKPNGLRELNKAIADIVYLI